MLRHLLHEEAEVHAFSFGHCDYTTHRPDSRNSKAVMLAKDQVLGNLPEHWKKVADRYKRK